MKTSSAISGLCKEGEVNARTALGEADKALVHLKGEDTIETQRKRNNLKPTVHITLVQACSLQ